MSPSEGTLQAFLLCILFASLYQRTLAIKGVWDSISHCDHHLGILGMNCLIWSRVCTRACKYNHSYHPIIEITHTKLRSKFLQCRSKGIASSISAGTHNAPSLLKRFRYQICIFGVCALSHRNYGIIFPGCFCFGKSEYSIALILVSQFLFRYLARFGFYKELKS